MAYRTGCNGKDVEIRVKHLIVEFIVLTFRLCAVYICVCVSECFK